MAHQVHPQRVGFARIEKLHGLAEIRVANTLVRKAVHLFTILASEGRFRRTQKRSRREMST
jgi:hypothetical protein